MRDGLPITLRFATPRAEDMYEPIRRDSMGDPRLSLRAKGLLCYLLTCRGGVNREALYGIGPDDRVAVEKAWAELESQGYLYRTASHSYQLTDLPKKRPGP